MAKDGTDRGRPTIWSEDKIQKLEEFFRLDCTDEEACLQAGVSEAAYYDKLAKDPDFMERMRVAQSFPMVLLKKTVLKAANDGDGNLALKVLKNRQRGRYFEKEEKDVTVREDAAKKLADSFFDEVESTGESSGPPKPTPEAGAI